MRALVQLSLAALSSTLLFAADPPLPPLPSDLPIEIKPAQTRIRPATNILEQPRQVTLPQFPRTVRPSVATVRPTPYTPPPSYVDQALAWDAVLKEFTAKHGDTEAHFSFTVTNIAATNIVINYVRPSCGCTLAKLPPTPWTLEPGESGTIELTLDLKGKYGTLFKYVNVDSSAGMKMLNIRATIPEGTTIAGVDQRMRNMQLAMADRQIVFRGDCARCHSAPLAGKIHGAELYQAGCAICHDTPNRATMVPDLKAVPNPGTKEYWQVWIRHGKPGTLMPAFARHQGGPLSEEQIEALSEYMSQTIPAKTAATRNTGGSSTEPPTAALRN